MRRPITANLVTLFVLSWLVTPAFSGAIDGTFSGGSTLTPGDTPGVFTQSFSGGGVDLTFGSFTLSSQSTIDFRNPPAIFIYDGMFLETFDEGTLFGKGFGEGSASGTGTATVILDIVFSGGTGLFAGAAGSATLTGMLTRTGPTTISIEGTFVRSLSIVPEPSALALMAPGLALGSAVVIRGRRRPEIAVE